MSQRRMARTVVLVEDEPRIRRFLSATLEAHGYRVVESASGARGALDAAQRKADLMIVDLGLPDIDGIEVIRRVRAWSSLPVIVLSARGREQDKVAALDAGADDYLTKPFGVGELLARLRVAERRLDAVGGNGVDDAFDNGELRVEPAVRRVWARGAEVRLTPIEYRLLAVLVRGAGRVLTHRQLLRDVWGPARVEQSHYLRVYMAALRHKLEAEPARPRFLLTEPGVGYRLALDPARPADPAT